MRLFVFVAMLFVVAPLFSQDVPAPSHFAPPPGLVSAAPNSAAFNGVKALMASDPAKELLGVFLTQGEVDRASAGTVLLDQRWVLVSRSKPGPLTFNDEEAFQQIARGLRKQTFTKSMADSVNNSLKATDQSAGSATDTSVSLGREQIVIDQYDCIAKSVTSQFTVQDTQLTMDMLMAYVRADGVILTIYAAAREDDPVGKIWLQKDVETWLRHLPTPASG